MYTSGVKPVLQYTKQRLHSSLSHVAKQREDTPWMISVQDSGASTPSGSRQVSLEQKCPTGTNIILTVWGPKFVSLGLNRGAPNQRFHYIYKLPKLVTSQTVSHKLGDAEFMYQYYHKNHQKNCMTGWLGRRTGIQVGMYFLCRSSCVFSYSRVVRVGRLGRDFLHPVVPVPARLLYNLLKDPDAEMWDTGRGKKSLALFLHIVASLSSKTKKIQQPEINCTKIGFIHSFTRGESIQNLQRFEEHEKDHLFNNTFAHNTYLLSDSNTLSLRCYTIPLYLETVNQPLSLLNCPRCYIKTMIYSVCTQVTIQKNFITYTILFSIARLYLHFLSLGLLNANIFKRKKSLCHSHICKEEQEIDQ